MVAAVLPQYERALSQGKEARADTLGLLDEAIMLSSLAGAYRNLGVLRLRRGEHHAEDEEFESWLNEARQAAEAFHGAYELTPWLVRAQVSASEALLRIGDTTGRSRRGSCGGKQYIPFCMPQGRIPSTPEDVQRIRAAFRLLATHSDETDEDFAVLDAYLDRLEADPEFTIESDDDLPAPDRAELELVSAESLRFCTFCSRREPIIKGINGEICHFCLSPLAQEVLTKRRESTESEDDPMHRQVCSMCGYPHWGERRNRPQRSVKHLCFVQQQRGACTENSRVGTGLHIAQWRMTASPANRSQQAFLHPGPLGATRDGQHSRRNDRLGVDLRGAWASAAPALSHRRRRSRVVAEHPVEGPKLSSEVRVIVRGEQTLLPFGQLIRITQLGCRAGDAEGAHDSKRLAVDVGHDRRDQTYGQVAQRSGGVSHRSGSSESESLLHT